MADDTTPAPAPTSSPAPLPAQRPRRTWSRFFRRALITLSLLLVLGLVAAELVARYILRLGDPPLYMVDAQTEYRMVPSRTYHRFYALSKYNQWSMRCDDFPEKKTNPKEFRLLVIGDSVVNGGPQTDQAELATEIVKRRLSSARQAPVTVANISCGSWGPPNECEYLKKFGTFDADVAVIVLNHEDSADVPTFAPLGRDFPTKTPVFALQEIFFRYLPMYFTFKTGVGAMPDRTPQELERDTQASLSSLAEMVSLLHSRNIKVVVILHAAKSELGNQPRPGTERLRTKLLELNIPTMNTADVMQQVLSRGGNPYRDDIHVTPEGQAALATILEQAVDFAR